MAVLNLPAVLMHAQASACRTQLVQAMVATQDRVVLLACRREALTLGRRLQVQGLSDRLRELAALYGVLELLQA